MFGFGVLVWFLIWWHCLSVSLCSFVLVGWLVFIGFFCLVMLWVFVLFCFLGKRGSVIFNSVIKYLNSMIFKEIPSY